jgi:hypothetical protein
MPVDPVVWEPPALTGRYPNMARNDAALWERYLKQSAAVWRAVTYDIRLGGQEVTDPNATELEKYMWRKNTAERIDVVADRITEQWVIEVRPNAKLGALGSAIGYVLLGQREPWTTLPLVPAVLTDNIAPDVRWVADQLGVQIIIVPEAVPRVL